MCYTLGNGGGYPVKIINKQAKKPSIQLSILVNNHSPEAVLEEVKYNFIQFYPVTNFISVRNVFRDFNDLFDGRYPGYRACNTLYHDKLHSTDTLLAMSRLIDGYNIRKITKLPVHQVTIALIATLLHDTGFIQTEDDLEGTGAKYTAEHIKRSIQFMRNYFIKIGRKKADFDSASNMVHCTGLNVNLTDIDFSCEAERTLGFMLGSADLLGQMSSRNYLEKLLLLYYEFKEGNIPGYDSEFNLLEKSMDFWAATSKRLEKDLNGFYHYAQTHFSKRYNIDANLYAEAIQRQIDYLQSILRKEPEKYRSYLRRK